MTGVFADGEGVCGERPEKTTKIELPGSMVQYGALFDYVMRR